MKILIVNNLYYPNISGGAERSAQGVAEALVARGHEVSVATLNPRRRHEIANINGVRVHYLPVWNVYFFGLPKRRSCVTKLIWHVIDTYNPLMSLSLRSVLDLERPDVVNTHNIGGFSVSVWKAVKTRKLPLVHTPRDYYLLCPRGMFHDGKLCLSPCIACRAYRWPRRRFSRLVDVMTGISRFVLEKHVHQVCFYGVQKQVIYNACEPKLRVNDLGPNSHSPVRFGFLGRFHRTKGVELLVRSFLALPEGSARLLIAGQGAPEYEQELKMLADGRLDVRWLGFVPSDVVFSQADVMVVPSLWEEPAGRVVLEAMAHGLPLIGSCRGGIPEQMGDGTGWIFDPDEPGALTRAMQKAIESRDELRRMRERAIQRARLFSTEAMVNGYLEAYSRAIEING